MAMAVRKGRQRRVCDGRRPGRRFDGRGRGNGGAFVTVICVRPECDLHWLCAVPYADCLYEYANA